MDLPVMPPVQPMLAKSVKGVPAQDSVDGGLSYEPKWDGFRCIVFRDGDEVVLASRSTKELTRYFPDVVAAVKAELPDRIVLDGEIFLAIDGRLEFDALSQRIHPADSRVQMLAKETPASFVAFDLLAIGDESLMDEPFSVRRARLEKALAMPRRSDPRHAYDDRRGRGREVVQHVRGRRSRRHRRQGASQAVRAERAHHAQDQALPHR